MFLPLIASIPRQIQFHHSKITNIPVNLIVGKNTTSYYLELKRDLFLLHNNFKSQKIERNCYIITSLRFLFLSKKVFTQSEKISFY